MEFPTYRTQQKPVVKLTGFLILVGMRGVEPPPSNLDLALNQARLPFRHIPLAA
jgi:hypothetical protein